jgi:polyisoprenoid-binding protein YceI
MHREGIMRTFVLIAVLAGAVPAFAESVWEIDPAHSTVQFSIRHMMVSNVRGAFTKVAGTVRADERDLTRSTIEATIDASSIDTREAKRDEHLRSPDFLDVAKYPTITFRSTKITKTGEGRYDVAGDLTLHGVTKPVVLAVEGPTQEVKDPRGALRAGATATTKIDRRDFGITWSKTLDGGGVVVGNDIAITIDVEGVKK